MAAWTMAAWRPKSMDERRSALKVSSKTWFHSRTTSADITQRSSSDSRDNAGRG